MASERGKVSFVVFDIATEKAIERICVVECYVRPRNRIDSNREMDES